MYSSSSLGINTNTLFSFNYNYTHGHHYNSLKSSALLLSVLIVKSIRLSLNAMHYNIISFSSIRVRWPASQPVNNENVRMIIIIINFIMIVIFCYSSKLHKTVYTVDQVSVTLLRESTITHCIYACKHSCRH